jgi:hypothetical protein
VVAFLMAVVGTLRAALRSRVSLVAENLALRQQLAILRRQRKRARLAPLDRAFWVVLVVLSCAWSRWAQSLASRMTEGARTVGRVSTPSGRRTPWEA